MITPQKRRNDFVFSFYSVALNASFCLKKRKLRKNKSEVFRVKIPQRKVTKCNTYNNSFFFRRLTTIQLNIFYQSGVCVPIKLVFSFEKNMWFFQESIVFIRTKISKRGCFLTRLYKNYNYLFLPYGEFLSG